MNEHRPGHPLAVHSPAVQLDDDGPATPATKKGVRAFFNDIAAATPTGTPATVLLKQLQKRSRICLQRV